MFPESRTIHHSRRAACYPVVPPPSSSRRDIKDPPDGIPALSCCCLQFRSRFSENFRCQFLHSRRASDSIHAAVQLETIAAVIIPITHPTGSKVCPIPIWPDVDRWIPLLIAPRRSNIFALKRGHKTVVAASGVEPRS